MLVDPKNIPAFRNIIEFVIRNPVEVAEIGRKAYETSKAIDNFNEFIDYTLEKYASLTEMNK